MKSYYIESSALLSWLVLENNHILVQNILDSSPIICTSQLTFTECYRVLIRHEAENAIKKSEIAKRINLLSIFENEWDILEVTNDIQASARKKFPIEPIRTLDAIHLATAIEFLKIYNEVSVLSFHKRIIENLIPLGLDSAI